VTAQLHTFTVSEDADGVRLDLFVVSVLPARSRSQIQRLIKDGQVQVAGREAKANQPVKAGQHISVEILEPVDAEPAPEALPLAIIYQDHDVIVVDKPAGMVVHPAAGHASGTLVNALLHYVDDLSGIGGEKRPGIVHRLDRGTSGLMVAAKHDAAHEELARQFRDREVEKEYVALVWGVVQAGRRIDAPIGRDPANRKKMSARARRSREAVTRIVRAEHLHPSVTLARVAIHTGRTHQIRVHLTAIGHPIVGDPLYGGIRRRVPGDLKAVTHLDRPFLHAARLAFKHPSDGRRMQFESPLPEDLQRILDELRGKDDEDAEEGE
jgi:23S rRNA pseudouridine1911/1915/1917 synthase